MGNSLTKNLPSIPLDESNDNCVEMNKVKTKKDDKSPGSIPLAKTGLFRNIFNSSDPRSPSGFITRTPLNFFRNNSNNRLHNESITSCLSVDLDILTPAEEESLNSNQDLTDAVITDDEPKMFDPRSPAVGHASFIRTPILASEQQKTKKAEDTLIKKITDKLAFANVSEDDKRQVDERLGNKKKSKKIEKNFIFEDDDDDGENLDRYSTPPNKMITQKDRDGANRTPLSCLANSSRILQPRSLIPSSTPKNNKLPMHDVENSTKSRIPVVRNPRKIIKI